MYFQLEVDYYSNEANKSNYKNVQLIASTKNNLKISIYCFVTCTSKYFVAWACYCLKVYLYNLKAHCCLKAMFVSARYKSLYIYINTIYVNKNQHSHSSRLQVYPLLSTNVGVSLFFFFFFFSIRVLFHGH